MVDLLPGIALRRPANRIRYTRYMRDKFCIEVAGGLTAGAGASSDPGTGTGAYGGPATGTGASEQWIVAYCDGGSRGNPGPAGFGVYIQDEQGSVLAELSEFLGTRTNNVAEYSGLLAALDFAVTQGHRKLRVVSDSELMVKQIQGKYRVNSPELRPLYEEAKRRGAKLEKFELRHVLREKNRQADRLANLAMDRGTGRAANVAAAKPSPPESAKSKPPQVLRGFVKDGVIHLLGAELPNGVFVKVTPE